MLKSDLLLPGPSEDFPTLRIAVGSPSTRLTIGDDILVLERACAMPSAWVQFWQRILLGWKWEQIEDDDE